MTTSFCFGGYWHTNLTLDQRIRTLPSGYQLCHIPIDLSRNANPCLWNEECKQKLKRSNSIDVKLQIYCEALNVGVSQAMIVTIRR